MAGFGKPDLPKHVLVKGAIDGDSLRAVDAEGNEHQIRIRGIDAPELSQEHGIEAKAALHDVAQHQVVALDDAEVDKFGRIAARVETVEGGVDLGAAMLSEGHAWACPHRATLTEKVKETTAKVRGKGLWQGRSPEQPWKHREKWDDSPHI